MMFYYFRLSLASKEDITEKLGTENNLGMADDQSGIDSILNCGSQFQKRKL